MSLALWTAFGEIWENDDKVSFNGSTKRIKVNSGVTELDIRSDVYSAWVRWFSLVGNSRYLPAMRFTGLDTIPGGFTGDSYFLINGWKLEYDPNTVAVSGVLFSDNYDTPYYTAEDKPVYPATVSSLVNTATVSTPALTSDNIIELVSAVWDAKISDYLSAGSTGAKLSASGIADTSPILDAISQQTTEINDNITTAVSGVSVTFDATDINNHTTAAVNAAVTDINNNTDLAVQSAAIDVTPITDAISAQTIAINTNTNTAVQNAAIDITPITDAIDDQTTLLSASINNIDIDPATIWSYSDRRLTDIDDDIIHFALDTYSGKELWQSPPVTDADLHNALDTYANKDNWKADIGTIDNTPVLAAIDNLNDLSLAQIEASTKLAKEATVLSIDNTSLTPTSIRAAFNPTEFKNTSFDIHTALDSYVNKADWKESAQADVAPVLDAIAALNDVSAAEVRAAFNPADFQSKNTETEIHNWLNSYTNKNAWQATVPVVNLTPITDAIANLNDISASDVVNLINPELFKGKNSEAEIHYFLDTYANKTAWKADTSGISTILSAVNNLPSFTVSDLHTGLDSYSNKNNWKATVTPTDLTPVLTAIDNIVDFNKTDLHTWLNNYTGKDLWKATTVTTDLTPILTAIANLNDVTVADIEASTVLAKQSDVATVNTIVSELINTDLTPVLTAINNLNDPTPAEIRSAFNPEDFKGKNTEAEIHAWMDSYVNKDDWKTAATDIADAVWNEVL